MELRYQRLHASTELDDRHRSLEPLQNKGQHEETNVGITIDKLAERFEKY